MPVLNKPPTSVPLLRAWMDRAGDIHLASNAEGGNLLLETVRRVGSGQHSRTADVRLEASAFPDSKNPSWQRGVDRVFNTLRLERVDDAGLVRYLHVGAQSDHVAEIKLGDGMYDAFVEACKSMASGDGDFCLGVGPPIISRREMRKLPVADRESKDVWFWGHGNIHRVNTF